MFKVSELRRILAQRSRERHSALMLRKAQNHFAKNNRMQAKYFRKQYRVNLLIKGNSHYKLIWANTPEQATRMLGSYWKEYITGVELAD